MALLRSSQKRSTYRKMLKHEHYMELALREAEQAVAEREVPVGAVGVYDDQVIALSHNVRERDQDPLAHAEMYILYKASRHLNSWRLEDLTLYVTLEPCLMCMGALLQARVKHLVFGAMDPKAGACGSLYNLSNDQRLNHTIKVTSGVMADQCGSMLKDFFAQLRQEEKV